VIFFNNYHHNNYAHIFIIKTLENFLFSTIPLSTCSDQEEGKEKKRAQKTKKSGKFRKK
jgi:hypothetical protein